MEPQVDQKVFAGPLDLLLYLVRKHEVDVFELAAVKIVNDYLDYTKQAKELNLDNAGEFLVLGSMLVEIKSRMLLPVQPGENGEEEPEDPRLAFIMDLFKYREVRETARLLEDLRLEQERRTPGAPAGAPSENVDLEQLSPFDLVAVFTDLLKETMTNKPKPLFKPEIPIDVLVKRVYDRLLVNRKATFKELALEAGDTLEIIGLFIALLELLRNRKVHAKQLKPFGDIHLWVADEAPSPPHVPDSEMK